MTGARLRRAAVLHTLCVCVALVSLRAGQPGAGEDANPRRFVVGAMRADGVVLPFAEYDNGKWSAPWPRSVRELEIPATLDIIPEKWLSGPLPPTWALWRAGGTAPTPITLRNPLVVLVGRARRIGLRSDHAGSGAVVPPSELPYPKEGLAVGGGAQVETIAHVSRYAAQWKGLTTLLREDIDEAEDRTIQGLKSHTKWVHPIEPPTRSETVATLESWYTSTLDQPGFALSYIEAVKKYPPGPEDEGCGLETFVYGWIHHNSRQPRPKTALTARVTYCDREGASYMLPLGLIRAGMRTHWVFQMSSWEREWYVVVQATPGRLRYLAEYYAGGIHPE